MIVRTQRYNLEEIVQIINVRAETETIPVDQAALAVLGEVGARASLRYAVQLLTPAWLLAQAQGKVQVEVDQVREADRLF